MRRRLPVLFVGVMLLGAMLLPATLAHAQDSAGQGAGHKSHRAEFAGMKRVSGEVTVVSGATLTVKTTDGDTLQVVTTPNTRLMQAGGAALTMSQIKTGDGVMAAGNLDAPTKTLHAAILFWTDGAQLRKMRADLGKTYIAGRVTAIDLDNATLTVKRLDGVDQTIGFDETTSFRRGRMGRGRTGQDETASSAPIPSGESITLADIKVGDTVRGSGSVKHGVFVPAELTVATPGQHRENAGQPAAGATTPK